MSLFLLKLLGGLFRTGSLFFASVAGSFFSLTPSLLEEVGGDLEE
jgi:hypothetical protein